MNIKGKKVLLRAIEEKDLPMLHQWANDPSICEMIGGWHFPSSMHDQIKWFETLHINSPNQRFAIENEKQELIGTANLVSINWKDRNAEHGMLLDAGQRGNGYAMDTVLAIMKYAFEELNLNRLDTTIIAYNEASLNLYIKKCGWKEEGRQRNWYFRKNQYWDRILAGITKEDYGSAADNFSK